MNKKEVLEIKKQFTPANCAITRICGCYVDHEKNKRLQTKDAFLSLPEEDAFKYFEIFKKTLSGSIGKNMLNMEFPINSEMPGGTQDFLLKLRNSKLQDDELLEQFYDKIIDSYLYDKNYYIVLIHAMYDVPGKSSDGTEMFDASDNVYEYIMCSICPVGLSKPGLSYDAEDNRIHDRIRDWVVDKPDKGFLFPAFADRETDIHSALYYTKKASDLQEDMIERVLGTTVPVSAPSQKDLFNELIESTLGEDADYNTVRNIHETLNEMIEENKEDPEPLELDKFIVKRLFEKCDVDSKKMELFDQHYKSTVGERKTLLAENITETKNLNIETPAATVKLDAARMDLAETKIIDGRKCLVIAVDDYLEVNGVAVRAVK
ncbi:DUF4317 domain-containing protein [Faecalicatena contorta]|uniref:DUF4317 domain-containing protein n=1 Tax=Faecalicatena contorta TaxID=39482 RepID=A0A315ZWS6_9FIRM|nr:DUF4317 domain-containing protein [Faecalicatena contorta]PWJ49340.1 uncharacterized protein DUF4317 [Faecalicatena contorta]SUQ14584.1 protein of unknown function [Faecalicatena contorta]